MLLGALGKEYHQHYNPGEIHRNAEPLQPPVVGEGGPKVGNASQDDPELLAIREPRPPQFGLKLADSDVSRRALDAEHPEDQEAIHGENQHPVHSEKFSEERSHLRSRPKNTLRSAQDKK